MAASRARAFALAAQSGLGSEAMEQVYADVRHAAQAYPQRPLPEILGQLVETQDLVFGLLESRQRPDHHRQLYFLAGVTGGLLAKASHDLGNPHAALTQARTAFMCADNADHHGLRAWVRGLQSLVSYWAGNPHDSVRYAQLGAGYAEQANSTTSVWLPVSEARAWAALGNADATRAALERAENAWGTVVEGDDLDEMGGLCTFGRNRQLYYAADALAWLPGERDTAERYSRQAVDAYTEDKQLTATLVNKIGIAYHQMLELNKERPYQSTTGDLRERERTWVYRRDRSPCRRCDTPVVVELQGPAGRERASYWCPSCQPYDTAHRGTTPPG